MNEFMRLLTPFLVGIGSIVVIVAILFLCAWFLTDDNDL